MAVSVDVMVKDDSVVPMPVVGAAVSLFDATTSQVVAQAISDDLGRAAFLLPGDVAPGKLYEARLFKMGVVFPRVVAIEVIEPITPPESNVFDISGTPAGAFGLPVDPRLCRCVGRFVNYMNQPMSDSLVRISAEAEAIQKTPKIVDGNMVSAGELESRTDKNGFVVIDLFRGGEYYITFAGEDDETWNFKVPDRATANLVELIHPQPVSLSYDADAAPDNQVTLAKGSTALVPVSVLFSDFQEHTTDLGNVIEFTNSDSSIADIAFHSNLGELAIVGMSPGMVELSVSVRPNLFPHRIPDYALQAPVLQVIITA
jgi:hypothetical protein